MLSQRSFTALAGNRSRLLTTQHASAQSIILRRKTALFSTVKPFQMAEDTALYGVWNMYPAAAAQVGVSVAQQAIGESAFETEMRALGKKLEQADFNLEKGIHEARRMESVSLAEQCC